MDFFNNNDLAVERLVKEYRLYNNLIIGFDFDCTIFDYHKNGLNVQPVINLLKRASDNGLTMCLHTLCLNYSDVQTKKDYCNSLGINVDYINESPILKKSFPTDRTKPFYSILLDDRAGLPSTFDILTKTLNIIKL